MKLYRIHKIWILISPILPKQTDFIEIVSYVEFLQSTRAIVAEIISVLRQLRQLRLQSEFRRARFFRAEQKKFRVISRRPD
jgi:hypothetical protein